MLLSLAAHLLELANVGGHQRAFGVVEKLAMGGVERKGVEAASERFVLAHGAALVAKVFAISLNANTAQLLFLNTGQADFEGGMSVVNGAASLALGAVFKQHVDP